jgi:hypothetical protein
MTIAAASIVAALSLIGFLSVAVIPRHGPALAPHVLHGVNSLLNPHVPLVPQGAELAFVIAPLAQVRACEIITET